MKRSGPAKAERVLRFLLALQDEEIASTLVAHGMRDEDVERGWHALRAMTPTSIESARVRPDTSQQRAAMRDLQRWTALWSAIIRAALEDRDPRACATVLGEHATLVSDPIVQTDRIVCGLEQLDPGARTVLRERGLTDAVLEDARSLIAAATAIAPPDDRSAYGVAREEAERVMWSWYLRWSAVARAAISNGLSLQRLGFGRPSAEAG